MINLAEYRKQLDMMKKAIWSRRRNISLMVEKL